MSKILVVDNNPDQMRSLRGLIEYRTSHDLVTAETNMEGVRAVVSNPPDLIMINALMYMHRSFSFHKAMQKSQRASLIPVLVHTSSELEDLTRRRMEVNGVAGFIGVPTSAGELNDKIDFALRPAAPAPTQGVKPVAWARAERPEAPKEAPKQRSWEVKPVDWAAIKSSPPLKRTASPAAPSSTARPPGSSRPPETPATRNGNDSSEFRPQTFQRVDSTSNVKRGADEKKPFEEMTFPKVDPDKVKNRHGK